jgi:hypothetical protein
MFLRRTIEAFGVLLVAASASLAQTYPLVETVKAGDCFRLSLDMKLSGEIRLRQDGKMVPIKLQGTGLHEFPERVLAVGSTGLPEKVARIYDQAKVLITRGRDESAMTLRPDRKLIVAQRHDDQPLLYSPAGSLSRDELDVTEHLDVLNLVGLLPGKAVAVGESWKIPSPVVQALCNFEGLTEHSLTGKLESVKGGIAVFTVSGSAAGIDVGALAKLKIEATGRFDLNAKRLIGLDWKQQDERDQGPVSPATAIETKIALKRASIPQPDALSDVALISVPADFKVPPPLVQLDLRDPKDRFSLLHGREWHVVAQNDKHLVMRLMERGDFIAQVTLSPWEDAPKGQKHLSPEAFKEAMNDIPGWEPEKELQSGEVPTDKDHWIYRFSVQGQMDGVEVLQNFYLVAGPKGEQVILTFTMTPKQADKLGARDLSFAASLEVPASKK